MSPRSLDCLKAQGRHRALLQDETYLGEDLLLLGSEMSRVPRELVLCSETSGSAPRSQRELGR